MSFKETLKDAVRQMSFRTSLDSLKKKGVQQVSVLGIDRIRAGDVVLVSGPVGDHGIAVMLAREQFGLRGDLESDAASVLPLSTKRVVWLPPLRATKASAPTFSVLISSTPAPLVLTLFSVWLPLRNSSLAPAAMW